MGKMSELDICIGELRDAAQSLKIVADNLSVLFAGNKSVSAETTITLEQVRSVLAEKSRAGFTAEVKNLLLKNGAEKLSAIDPDKYSALLAEAEVLGNE